MWYNLQDTSMSHKKYIIKYSDVPFLLYYDAKRYPASFFCLAYKYAQ